MFQIEDQFVEDPNATHQEQLKTVTAQNTELRAAVAKMKSRVRRLEDSAAISAGLRDCLPHCIKESVPKPEPDIAVLAPAVQGIPAAFPVVVGNLGEASLFIAAIL